MQGKFSSHQSQDGDVGPDNKKSLCCLLLVCDNERKRDISPHASIHQHVKTNTKLSPQEQPLCEIHPRKINRFYLFLLLLGCFDDSWIRLPGFTKVVEQSQGVNEEGHVDGGKGEMCMRSRKKTGFHLLL